MAHQYFCLSGHPNPENFEWEDYLQETGSTAAPSSAFTMVRKQGGSVIKKGKSEEGEREVKKKTRG